MRMVIQRVRRSSLTADGIPGDAAGAGLLVLVGIKSGDLSDRVFAYMADKLLNLRIFEDEQGKMNRSVIDTAGEVFLVSNFTLYGDCRHGRRPGYSAGASPDEARGIYEAFVSYLREQSPVPVKSGVFQADMQIETCLDGPVTLLLDSEKVF